MTVKRRVKNWLIGKLGGIPVTQKIGPPDVIFKSPRNIVKFQVERAIPMFQIDLMTPEEEADAVNRCLGSLLGSGLIENGLVDISVKREPDRKVFYGSIRVVKGEADD